MVKIKKICLASCFVGIGLILPLFTGQIRLIGNMLLPMHLPVLLCGLICGPFYGLMVGMILPILRSFIFGMPVLYPNAIGMSIELLTYGFVVGIIYTKSKYQCIISLYRALIIAMIFGRIVWGIASAFLYGIIGKGFTYKMFIAAALFNAIPGIILQLTIIPIIMLMLDRTSLVKFRKTNERVVKN